MAYLENVNGIMILTITAYKRNHRSTRTISEYGLKQKQ